jgi:hypothetical protein
MKKQYRQEIKTVDDYNDVVSDILDCWLEDFVLREGLTREPDEEDYNSFGGDEIGFMYTQNGMKLYWSAVSKLKKLGQKMFPEDEHNVNVKANGMLFP